MSQRKFNFDHLTPEQLEIIAKAYPDAVMTVTTRKPNYKILSMLATCKVVMPEGIILAPETLEPDDKKPAFILTK